MNIKKKILIGAVLLSLLVAPAKSFALTAAELQTQINAIIAQIAVLQAELAKLTSNTSGSSSSSSVAGAFNTDLSYGMSGLEVSKLQETLKQLGFYFGSITNLFGDITKLAVQRFQAANGIEATGFVGPQTRTALNAKIASGTVTLPSVYVDAGVLKPTIITSTSANYPQTNTSGTFSTSSIITSYAPTATQVVLASPLNLNPKYPGPTTFTPMDYRVKELQEAISTGGAANVVGTYKLRGPKVVYATQPSELTLSTVFTAQDAFRYSGTCQLSGQNTSPYLNPLLPAPLAFSGPSAPGDYIYTYGCSYRNISFPYASPITQAANLKITSIPLPAGATNYQNAERYYFALDYPTSLVAPHQLSTFSPGSYSIPGGAIISFDGQPKIASYPGIEAFDKVNLTGPDTVSANSSATFTGTAVWNGDKTLTNYDRTPLSGVNYSVLVMMYDNSVESPDGNMVKDAWNIFTETGTVASPRQVSVTIPFNTLTNAQFKKAMWRMLTDFGKEMIQSGEANITKADKIVERENGIDVTYYSWKDGEHRTVFLPYPSSNKFVVCMSFNVNYFLKQNLGLKVITSDMMQRTAGSGQCKIVTMN